MQAFPRLRVRIAPFKLYMLGLIWRLKYTLWREKMPKNADGKVYLNLGAGGLAGEFSSEEFINIDVVPFKRTHRVADIQDLSMFPSNSVDMVYASHVIEHLPRKNLEKVLREWCRVLKPGGILRFGVPDFDNLIEIYRRSGNDVNSIVANLLGQDGEYDDHHTIWNTAFATALLEKIGFIDVRSWDPRATEHHQFKDKANRVQRYPDGSVVSISLNLEATKR